MNAVTEVVSSAMALDAPAGSNVSETGLVIPQATRARPPEGPYLETSLSEHRDADVARLSVTLTPRGVHAAVSDPATYFFEIEGDLLPSPQTTSNLALVAMLFPAMRAGLPLHVVGSVSSLLMRNLEEYQEIWGAWCPELYRPVPISADLQIQNTAPRDHRKAALLYSRGVDANFTLLSQQDGSRRHRKYDFATAILVHGFDTPLSRTTQFAEHCDQAREILSRYNVPLTVIRTNWRECEVNYTHGHATALTACLHAFENDVTTGVLASDRNYRFTSRSPNGSNPLSNPLLSSDRLAVVTDGAGATRSEKVARIATHPFVRDRLQVCFTENSRNCGTCEKCIRTILNFEAQGLSTGESFSSKPSWWRIACNFYWMAPTTIHYYREIIDLSRRNHTSRSRRWLLWFVVLAAQMKTTLRRQLPRRAS